MKNIITIIILFSINFNVFAQVDAKDFAQKYLSIIKHSDVEEMTRLMHPDALNKFKYFVLQTFNDSKKKQAKSDLFPIFKVSSLKELKALDASKFYNRFNAWIYKTQPRLVSMMRGANTKVIGVVNEKEFAHVLYRLSLNINCKTIDKLAVISLKKHGDNWRSLLTQDAETSAMGLKNRYQ